MNQPITPTCTNGINDISTQFGLKAYPNLAEDKVILSGIADKGHRGTAKIYDNLGQLVQSIDLGEINGKFDKTLNLSDLTTGLYLYEVKTRNGKIFKGKFEYVNLSNKSVSKTPSVMNKISASNHMRVIRLFIFLIVTLLGTVHSYAQLCGAYATPANYTGCGFVFEKDGTFRYVSASCTTGSSAYGHYTMHDSTLVMYYEVSPISLKLVDLTVLDSIESPDDSLVHIQVELRDMFTHKNISWGKLQTNQEKAKIHEDSTGHYTVTVRKSNEKLTLYFSASMYRSKKYSLYPTQNVRIKAYLGGARFRDQDITTKDHREEYSVKIIDSTTLWIHSRYEGQPLMGEFKKIEK